MTDPLPTFLRVRSMLLMEEMQQANAAANATSTALVAQTRPHAPTCTSAGCRGDSSNSGKSRKQKNKTGGKTTGGPTRPGNPAPQGPWVCFSPGMGQWRAPYTGPGILGPRPQAYTTTATPVFQSTPSSFAAPAWDNAGLIAALNSLYQQGGWVMDSGATSHMTNDEGNILFTSPLSSALHNRGERHVRAYLFLRLHFFSISLWSSLSSQPRSSCSLFNSQLTLHPQIYS
jgi:hypothetical protein